MSDYKASHTALGTAYLRAAHQLFDAKPLLFDDPVALSLLGPKALKLIQDTEDNYRTPEMLALRAHVVLRSRFTRIGLPPLFPAESHSMSSLGQASIPSFSGNLHGRRN